MGEVSRSRQYRLDGRRLLGPVSCGRCGPVSPCPEDVVFQDFFMGDKRKQATGVFDPFEDVLDAIRNGEMVIVVDDEGRENEGDLVCAAEKVTPEIISFMARKGCGLICVAMQAEDLSRLGLSRMIPYESGDKYRTAFMESVDARCGVTTGISAADRALTIQVMVDGETRHRDLVRPGHVFPLEAKAMGVLERPGHTEAAVDLARLAGVKPAGVICEVLREDGEMARVPDLEAFKAQHGLKMTSVAAVIAYRQRTETLVELQQEIQLPTEHGLFKLQMYESQPDHEHHLALVMGDPVAGDKAPLVRMHSECLTGDVFGSQRCDCGSQLDEAMRVIAEDKCGVVIYLRQEGRGIGLAHKIHAYALQEQGLDTVEANEKLGFGADLRDYGMGAQILRSIGVERVRLITNNPDKIEGLEKSGITVDERVSLQPKSTEHNLHYLETKKAKLGHLF